MISRCCQQGGLYRYPRGWVWRVPKIDWRVHPKVTASSEFPHTVHLGTHYHHTSATKWVTLRKAALCTQLSGPRPLRRDTDIAPKSRPSGITALWPFHSKASQPSKLRGSGRTATSSTSTVPGVVKQNSADGTEYISARRRTRFQPTVLWFLLPC